MKRAKAFLRSMKKPKHSVLIILIINLLNLLIYAVITYHPSLADTYSTRIYPILVGIVSRITSIFPFSLIELLILLSFFFIITKIIIFPLKFIMNRIHIKHSVLTKQINYPRYKPMDFFLRLGIILSSLVFIFTITCGINYYRNTFSDYVNIKVTTYTTEDLVNLCNSLVEETNRLSLEVPVNEDGLLILPDNVRKEASISMKNLGKTYPILSGYYPNPKPVLTSTLMSYQFIMGIYSPFTIEANYNTLMPSYNIPWTMCHELSHVKGFMREDEAEFIAYLACTKSENKIFNYCGNLMALEKSINALNEAGESELCQSIYSKLSDQAKNQLLIDTSYWESYQGTISEVASQTNDVYLKVNNQSDGEKSYGKMVDLLLAYYKQTDFFNK